ncbi:MAG: SEC-C domain-containing protein [Chitinispirillaceae bacterium]|nr:SEC-C domain-containing protein [Chitinispirillaceae bacterium]
MITSAIEYIQDYLSSEYFYFLDSSLKEQAEPLLQLWCETTGINPGISEIENAFKKVAQLNISLETKKRVGDLVNEFYTFLSSSGKIPEAQEWIPVVNLYVNEYRGSFREDGSVRGTTHVKKYSDTGRNDPCPCGSGKKFKKCCMALL